MRGKQQKLLVDPEDWELIKLAQKGDEQAFTKLVTKYEDLVFKFAFKVCRNKERAEESLQDTFINVFRKLKQFDGRSKFSTWLYSITTNNCLMKVRKGKLEKATVRFDESESFVEIDEGEVEIKPVLPPSKVTPLDTVMNNELRDLLDKAIQKLPYDYRIVFVLCDIEGETAAATAKILKLSVPAVKSRLRRARMFLREQLHHYMVV